MYVHHTQQCYICILENIQKKIYKQITDILSEL